MNPIVYNKNGQHRFTDFVGYLPEFLRSEPDVVTYLQVMSDYINNAYRNIDVTEEFELVKACTSTNRKSVQKWMERLYEMFKLACDRGDRVMYLSVPRNNTKSNVILGSDTSETVRIRDVNFEEIVESLSSVDMSGLNDGDIVYLHYTNRKLREMVAYYYIEASKTLQKDPMASSQDPFSGTYNDPSTAIQFNVAEVGKVLCRYGGSHDGMTFYEVYFPIHITGIERVAAKGVAAYDVNGDGKEDRISVDYYHLESPTGTIDSGLIDTYDTYIKFGDSNGFKWSGEYPTGMFYFRDTSAASLTNLSSTGTMDISDTLSKPSVDRYHITKIEKPLGMNVNSYRVYLESFPGLYSNAVFYIMDGSKSRGVYKMMETMSQNFRYDSGTLYIELANISGYSYDDQIVGDFTNLTLLVIPLAHSKYILNFNDSWPIVAWTNEVSDLMEHSIGLNSNISMRRATLITNEPPLYDEIAYQLNAYTIQISKDLSSEVKPGDILLSDVFANTGWASVSYSRRTANGMFQIVFDKGQIDSVRIQRPIQIRKMQTGIISSVTDGDDASYLYFNAVMSTSIPGTIEYFVATVNVNDEQKEVLFHAKDVNVYHDGAVIKVEKPDGVRITVDKPTEITLVEEDSKHPAAIYEFKYVKHRDANTIIGSVSPRYYSGDIFSAKYMLAASKGSKDYSLLYMKSDVMPMDPKTSYEKDTYLYDSTDHLVKKLIRNVVVNQNGDIEDRNSYIIDRIAHYSVGLMEVSNTYMPYCGSVSTLDYDETINYAGNMRDLRIPLYVKKVNDVRLKYGWKQREYVYYHDNIGVAPLSRSGFVETYSDNIVSSGHVVSNPRSPVNINLRKSKNTHLLPANTVLFGCGERLYTVDIDSEPIAERVKNGEWVVTVMSSGHGLPDGTIVTASVNGDDDTLKAIFNTDGAPVRVISPDCFQYTTTEYTGVGYVMKLNRVDDLSVKYDRSYIDDKNKYPIEGDLVVVGADLVDDNGLVDYELVDDAYPKLSNNQIAIGGTLYVVAKGAWKAISSTDIVTPITLYCRHNLFDVSLTNPTFARSEGYVIKSISTDGEVVMSARIPELDVPNAADIYNDNGRVYIEFVNQGALCGWHTIKQVHNGGAFSIYLDPSVTIDDYIVPITNRRMTAYIGRWYKYDLKSYDWDKKSNLVSYVTSNAIQECDSDRSTDAYRYKMKYKHNLAVGDHVLIDSDGKTVYDVSKWDTSPIIQSKVTAVIDEYTVELDCDEQLHGYLYKGYIISGMNLKRLYGEYSIQLGDEIITFADGDVVITKDQVCLDERRGWKVTAKTAWIPMSAKRTFKIDEMSVDMRRNPLFDAGDDLDDAAEYEYVTVTDGEVSSDETAYTIGYACARNYHFEHPHIEYLDTTQKPELEYSSKYDYASVAPRADMDPSFKGIPDMGYPLAERIERLAYLRDPEVIDIDLIGYLARFMGYDITAVADDIKSSNIYRNSQEREAALRATIAHLPQYYALSGTKPGINMLMAAFGLVGELVTMWTKSSEPYRELIRPDEVGARMNADVASGDTSSTWVPTPHFMVDILANDNFTGVLLGTEELSRMKEQIRCCKPIQTVFDGIRVIYNSSVTVYAIAVTPGGTLRGNTAIIDPDIDETTELAEDPCMDEDCGF